jgi:hypothetical protein
MAQKENIFVALTSQYDGKAFAKANKDMNSLTKLTKTLGKGLASIYAGSKIIDFGKSSVAAFNASEKSAKALNTTLKNTGSLLAFPDAMSNIKALSQATGVADTDLTNAFTTLYSSTGDAVRAQKDLATAVDVSKGTGNDLITVVDAMSAGYRGNTKALANLNAGLDAATLATKDMDKITQQLATLQAGQAAAYAETYAGKLDRIKVATDDLKVSVGQGLVGALQALSGSKSIDDLTNGMHTFGLYLEAVIIRFGELARDIIDSPLGKFLAAAINGFSLMLGVEDKAMELQNEIWRQNTKALEQYYAQKAEQDKINAEYRKRLKLLDAEKAKQLALKKAHAMFDINQIEIIAALQNQVSDEEKLRLQLQLALLQDNATEAEKLAKQLAISQLQTTNLAQAIANIPPALNPFKGWGSEIDNLLAKMIEMYKLLNQPINVSATASTTTTTTPSSGYQGLFDLADQQKIAEAQRNRLNQEMSNPESGIQGGILPYNTATYNINIDATNMVDPSNMTTVVQNALLLINRNGLSQVPAGQGF